MAHTLTESQKRLLQQLLNVGRWHNESEWMPQARIIMRSQKNTRTTDALKLLDRLTGVDPAMHELVEQERANLAIARKLHELRTKAGLSQAELAKRVGTTQSVISRLEDADYEGHSLAMLNRIASAMKKQVEIRFVPARRKLNAA